MLLAIASIALFSPGVADDAMEERPGVRSGNWWSLTLLLDWDELPRNSRSPAIQPIRD